MPRTGRHAPEALVPDCRGGLLVVAVDGVRTGRALRAPMVSKVLD